MGKGSSSPAVPANYQGSPQLRIQQNNTPSNKDYWIAQFATNKDQGQQIYGTPNNYQQNNFNQALYKRQNQLYGGKTLETGLNGSSASGQSANPNLGKGYFVPGYGGTVPANNQTPSNNAYGFQSQFNTSFTPSRNGGLQQSGPLPPPMKSDGKPMNSMDIMNWRKQMLVDHLNGKN